MYYTSCYLITNYRIYFNLPTLTYRTIECYNVYSKFSVFRWQNGGKYKRDPNNRISFILFYTPNNSFFLVLNSPLLLICCFKLFLIGELTVI
jgi:hypothetical protein